VNAKNTTARCVLKQRAFFVAGADVISGFLLGTGWRKNELSSPNMRKRIEYEADEFWSRCAAEFNVVSEDDVLLADVLSYASAACSGFVPWAKTGPMCRIPEMQLKRIFW
jgi:hypothetical protein